MGKRRFNAKGRQTQKFLVDNSETKKIKVDIPVETKDNSVNDTNALVLPSKKRATKIKKENVTVTRILSKKQRKRLEKIVDQKEKKKNHAALVQALASVQIPKAQLSQYTSISTTQTQGLKKLKNDGKETKRMREQALESEEVPVKGKRRKGMVNALAVDDESDDEDEFGVKKHRDFNVVGVDSSDESSCSDDESIEEIDTEPIKEEQTTVMSGKNVESSVTIVDEEPIVTEVKVIDRKPATYIHLERDSKMQAARLKLPILAEEQQIMEIISENTVIIIAGETGSGKTTQVPQFLYEAGYATQKLIGVTEPRRVASISMSKRVAKEMNLGTDVVSYLMRFEGNVTEQTKIKFMTDGVLLKEVENDFLLKKYGVIILDEAHERSVFTDVLIGLLSRIVIIREKEKDPLKLIIMSATLRVEDFTKNEVLFKQPPPVLKVEARQFPVTVHFNRVTSEDYLAEAYRKAVKIHTKLPEGGILIFLTGQKEVKNLVWKLRRAFPYQTGKGPLKQVEKESSSEVDSFDEEDWDMIRHKKKKLRKKDRVNEGKNKRKAETKLPKVNLDAYKLPHESTANASDENDVSEVSGDSDAEQEVAEVDQTLAQSQPLWVLPLYSVLSSEKQALVFQDPPPGTRLCVVATNVAETSITIPNIKYVIDSGRQKSKVYDKLTGVSAFVVTFTSKASANQRAGRAGRIGPGHCYRLYSSAVYNDEFKDFSVPEIQEKPVDDLMLQMRAIGIDRVDKFPFPSPPDPIQLEVAERRLKMLGALEEKTLIKGNTTETVLALTDLGKTIARFPVNPRFGKMLALSDQGGLLPYIISIVASLSVPNVLEESTSSMDDEEKEEEMENQSKFRATRHKWAGEGESRLLGDPMVLLKAVSSCLFDRSSSNLEKFCADHGIRIKAIHEIAKIRQQLTNEININATDVNICIDPKLSPPTDSQIHLIRQILLSGFGDQVARKFTKQELNEMENKHKYRYAYKCLDMVDPVFVHQESVLKYEDPEWVIYQEVYEVTMDDGTQRMFIRGITAIDPAWLPKYVPTLCNVLKILDKPAPRYDSAQDRIVATINATFSKAAWQLPMVEVPMQSSVDLYKHFAKCLLNGDIFERLAEYTSVLTATPDSMNKTWVKSMPRAKNILDVLMQNEVTTKKKLKKLWKQNKEFLLEEYKLWLPDHLHAKVSKMWPPFD